MAASMTARVKFWGPFVGEVCDNGGHGAVPASTAQAARPAAPPAPIDTPVGGRPRRLGACAAQATPTAGVPGAWVRRRVNLLRKPAQSVQPSDFQVQVSQQI